MNQLPVTNFALEEVAFRLVESFTRRYPHVYATFQTQPLVELITEALALVWNRSYVGEVDKSGEQIVALFHASNTLLPPLNACSRDWLNPLIRAIDATLESARNAQPHTNHVF